LRFCARDGSGTLQLPDAALIQLSDKQTRQKPEKYQNFSFPNPNFCIPDSDFPAKKQATPRKSCAKARQEHQIIPDNRLIFNCF
jgi:hypothetical protein